MLEKARESWWLNAMLYPELDPGTKEENISRKIGEIWIMSVYLIVSYQC